MANTRRHRRGLSTVIGAVFMILVTVGALNVVLWTLQQQNRVAESIIEKSNSNLNKLNEEIAISDVSVTAADKLSMTVTNTGGAAATLKSLYVVDETAVPKVQERYDLDLIVDGRESLTNVGEALALTLVDDRQYSVRLVTESGNTVATTLTPLSLVTLPMELYVIPPTVAPGDTVTILYVVTNDLVDTTLAEDITPVMTLDPDCTGSCVLTEISAPSGSISLPEGTTRLFKWVYQVDAPDETILTFTASLVGASNSVAEDVSVRLIDEAQISTSTTQVIYSSLVQKPEIFLVIPSPFGDNGQKGLWGVVVSNPTGVDMTVSRVVINAYTSKTTGGGSAEMIPSGSGCETAIYPDPGSSSEWTCPHSNMIQWKDVANPEPVDPMSSKSFLARVIPGNPEEEPAFMVSVAVFTNMGQFTKTGYSSGLSATDNAVANVFMSDTNDPLLAYQDGHILTHKNSIASGSTVTYNIALVDFDNVDDYYINSGTKLIINVPTDFTEVTPVTPLSGFNSAVATEYPDGSTQIVADLSEAVGDINGIEAKVLSFTAKAPTVTADKIYIMYALLDGESTPSNFSVGALAEMPLQVVS